MARRFLLPYFFLFLIACLGQAFPQTAAIDGKYFPDTVYPVLRKAGCPGCHNPDGVASGTRLHFPDEDASADRIERFGKSLSFLVDTQNPDKSLLLNKPTRRIAHAGGKRIAPGSPDESILRNWIVYLAKNPGAPVSAEEEEPRVAAVPVLRRLTHSQYNNTVRDLLGDDSRLADQFPPEDFVNGFKNQYQSQSISPLLAEAYSAAAEKLAKNVFRAGDTKGLVPCKPSSAADAACRVQFIRFFGKKAFRRPLLEAEAQRYSRLFASEAASKKSFLAGAQIVVEAMLQSPNFLTRAENGSDPQTVPYETASRIAYFIWNTTPDAALFRAAESGQLNSPAGVETQARRLLRDPRARQAMDEFAAQWLRFDRLTGSVKDRGVFPMYTPELALSMLEETRRLASDLIWKNGDFRKFYSADYTFLSSDLAALYKLPAPKNEFDKVSLPPESERAGIVGQATFLALTSKPEETSPTARGLFVREQFLCQDVPPPPPGVNANLPALSKAKPQTSRERLAMHLNNETCASCHSLMDPIGFGLEKFDALGQRREKFKLRFLPEHGEKKSVETIELPLDSDGNIAGIPNSQFSSPRTLGNVLASSVQCQECMVKQLFRYEAGRKEGPSDRAAIRRSFEDFRNSQFRFQELMVSLVKWSIFQPQRKEPDVVSGN
ncbi:MAG: DUF1592 domain-containing protein [Bryobacteraceae bacterium]